MIHAVDKMKMKDFCWRNYRQNVPLFLFSYKVWVNLCFGHDFVNLCLFVLFTFHYKGGPYHSENMFIVLWYIFDNLRSVTTSPSGWNFEWKEMVWEAVSLLDIVSGYIKSKQSSQKRVCIGLYKRDHFIYRPAGERQIWNQLWIWCGDLIVLTCRWQVAALVLMYAVCSIDRLQKVILCHVVYSQPASHPVGCWRVRVWGYWYSNFFVFM